MSPNVLITSNPKLPYPMEEGLNRLRINVSFFGSGIRKIMIVSSEPDEGKSLIAMHLWLQMAKTQEKAILVDADMRNSRMIQEYGMVRTDGKKMWGLSHYLSGSRQMEDCILHTDYGSGDILPNVKNVVNPSLLLESTRFGELLDSLEKNYRYVFLDTPPLGLVSDGERIGHFCDGAILVIRSGVTSKKTISNSIAQLERTGCPILGMVLNRVNPIGRRYYSKYYRGYYGKYYGRYYGSSHEDGRK